MIEEGEGGMTGVAGHHRAHGRRHAHLPIPVIVLVVASLSLSSSRSPRARARRHARLLVPLSCSCSPPHRRAHLPAIVLVAMLASPSSSSCSCLPPHHRAHLPVIVLIALASCSCSLSHSPPLPRAYVHCFHSRSIRTHRDVFAPVVTCFCTSRQAIFSIRWCVCVRAPVAMHLRPSLCVHICLVRSACTCHLTHL